MRGRKRQRRKELLPLVERMEASLGASPISPEDQVDRAQAGDIEVLLVKGVAVAMVIDGEPFPTVRGLLTGSMGHRYVTVDMGAVPYVTKGADVMAPGIVDADPEIQEGDMVWVRDERNLVPLAVGRALIPAGEMVKGERGKAVRTLHQVGDWLWKIGED